MHKGSVCIVTVDERYNEILNLLLKHKKLRSKETAYLLNVSFETIRRDFETLELQGKLKRIHGGAEYIEPKSDVEKNFIERENLYAEEKKEIARKATQFVNEGMSIALDVSTTNTAIARCLARKFNRLTIITNSLPIIEIVAKITTFTVIVPGGVLYNQERCIIGDVAIDHISKYNIDLFFMSLSGIDMHKGYTDYGMEEVKIKKAFHSRAQTVVAVADHSKFDNVSLIHLGDDGLCDVIISDDRLDENIKEKYASKYKII